ncbi:TIGR01777 family oxidoreductase [Catenovulum adriaticum]|uniref:TIGR01777 family oxidoreductase n=1 Tax=Catenovulum adriaticum TaxID=2984846 RepID=A0ABY7ATI8_9ALTE|nr:TIGR01777 family oxidoreductase [Catenovulum sp. TS8]WAJ72426.1 TIGR01777 family oxidoreductase [Catenovulum sp. TS8]
MKILFTGGTGLIGTHLIRQLKPNHKISVLTRAPSNAFEALGHDIEAYVSLDLIEKFNFDAIINLAGEPIADKRWSNKQKQKICQSRWQITQDLIDKISQSSIKPKVFISGSAVGFYGSQKPSAVIDELHNDINPEFTHKVCVKWEKIANQLKDQTRLCIIRTGIVLAKHGGALTKMKIPYQLGIGGPIGDGEQMMSWIHIDDVTSAIEHLLTDKQCAGVYNLTAPHPVNNNQFSQTLASCLHRPNVMRMPQFVMKFLFGEMSTLLLDGQAVIPTRLLDAGFHFRYPDLQSALTQCLSTNRDISESD